MLAARLSGEDLREPAIVQRARLRRAGDRLEADGGPRGRDAVGRVLGAAVDDAVADHQQRAAAGPKDPGNLG